MKKLVLVAALAIAGTASTPARADVSLGLMFGEPTGIDLKFGIDRWSALQVFWGYYDWWADYRGMYTHLTYLFTPFVGHGRSVIVPFRFGLGVAFYGTGAYNDDINIAARLPLEVALKFRRAPLELYGELSFQLTFFDDHNDNNFFDVMGGAGLRVYF